MKKSFKFLIFGAGLNQYDFIKYSIKKNNKIVIHNKKINLRD
jgi:hypothetical protein